MTSLFLKIITFDVFWEKCYRTYPVTRVKFKNSRVCKITVNLRVDGSQEDPEEQGEWLPGFTLCTLLSVWSTELRKEDDGYNYSITRKRAACPATSLPPEKQVVSCTSHIFPFCNIPGSDLFSLPEF